MQPETDGLEELVRYYRPGSDDPEGLIRLFFSDEHVHGFVYFIGVVINDEIERVKIGYSRDVDKRLATLVAENAYPLRVLGVLPAKPDREFILHRAFREFRLHGEWFEYVEPIKDLVKIAEPFKKKVKRIEIVKLTIRKHGERFLLAEVETNTPFFVAGCMEEAKILHAEYNNKPRKKVLQAAKVFGVHKGGTLLTARF
jgi:hypothetical protein